MAKSQEFEIVTRLVQWSKDESSRLQTQADRRVAFFLALVSLFFASRLLLSEDLGIPILFILLLYGCDTLLFLNSTKIREKVNNRIDKIINEALSKLSRTAQRVIIANEQAEERLKNNLWWIHGGFRGFMYLTNSVLGSVIVFELSQSPWMTGGSFALMVLIQLFLSHIAVASEK